VPTSTTHTLALIGATPTAELIAARALGAGLIAVIDDVSDARLQATSLHLRGVVGAQHCCAPGPRDQSDLGRSDFSFSAASIPNLTLTQSIESAIRAADFILDTLPDDLEVKLELFTLFDKFAIPNAIFVTTGSTPIDDLAEITFCPERCISIRITPSNDSTAFNFEIIPGTHTSAETVARATALFEQLR
jgi:3-hydroxybutyryl-CoA dehydrogenase